MSRRVEVKPGDRYGRLTVVREVEPSSKRRDRRFLLACDCGGEKLAQLSNLRSGNVRSCGCLKRELLTKAHTKHGMVSHPAISAWYAMSLRCSAKCPAVSRDRYFGRGIAVCPEWRDDPVAFCRWADASGFAAGLEIDRRDNDGDYAPKNCRWISHAENSRNTARCFWWHVDGVRHGSMTLAARAIGVTGSTVRQRCLSPKFPHYWREPKYPDTHAA